jgi:hypothetical protein
LQFLPHRDWKPFLREEGDGGDLKWMYDTLMNAGNEKLAYHVAMTMKDVQLFCGFSVENKDSDTQA